MNVSRPILRTLAVAAFCAMTSASFAQVVNMKAEHDTSKALRDIKPIPPAWGAREEHEVKPIPHGSAGGHDTALQTAPIATAATITSGSSFDGVGISSGYAVNGEPPDTNGSVGATQYVQWVNTAFAIYDKATGAKVYGPANGNTLWSGSTLANGRCASDNSGDPIVLYDKQNQRWIMTQFAVSKSPYYQCVAISQTSDATGKYNLYAYNFSTNFNDYPKVGVFDGNYYFTFNLFARGRTFAGADICAMDGASSRSGAAANMLCYNVGKSYGGVLPADVDGASGATGTTSAPAPGTAEYFVNFGSNSLNVWRMTPNFSAGTASVTGPTNVAVSAFSEACGGGTCIPQPSVSQQLDSLADRMMYRLSYRNFGTYASLLTNHSVVAGSSTGIRWYELRAASSTSGLTVNQQGTYAPDASYRWMGSVAQDKQGNIATGYSVSSSSLYPAIRFATRAAADPAGQLSGEQSVLAGGGSQNGHSRWGDYASVSVDPTDDCTMWFTTEYLNQTGDFIWSTHITNFKLGTCQ